MKKISQKWTILFLMLLSSCSSPSVIKIISTPEDAQVSIVNDNGTTTVIGKTPFNSNQAEVYRNEKLYSQVKISKDNFQSQEILLMKSPTGSEATINVQLKSEEVSKNHDDQLAVQEKIANSIAHANGLIQSKQYAEAESLMLHFIELYPSISVGYDYLGNLNYIQRRFAKALKYYNKALSLNPQNTERHTIVEKIKNLVKEGEAQ
jgi:TolA-binding protein